MTYKEWTDQDHLELVKNWKLHGLTNVEIAQRIGIAEKTLYVWLKKSPKLKKAIRGGKDIARAKAENALYELALNGDRQALFFWLKNNYREHYSDKPLSPAEADLMSQKARLAKLQADLAEAQLKAIKEDQGDQATQLNNLLDSLKEAVLDEGISPNNIVPTGNGLIIDDISDS
ncbi:transposase [Lactobacillus delbrueckii]|uniref:transposase n=1 Tax=Lactobacillus delbrueckii TaxID=1584 RepID=UPI0011084D78|nr:transposase [Lactobacillus delbrueckii]TLQ28200.1 transposase [Lactobacillus delbrueckii subsp. lactis]